MVMRVSDYTQIPVGKLCTRQDISTHRAVDYSLKYKIGISCSSSLFVMALSFFYIAAMKSRWSVAFWWYLILFISISMMKVQLFCHFQQTSCHQEDLLQFTWPETSLLLRDILDSSLLADQLNNQGHISGDVLWHCRTRYCLPTLDSRILVGKLRFTQHILVHFEEIF